LQQLPAFEKLLTRYLATNQIAVSRPGREF